VRAGLWYAVQHLIYCLSCSECVKCSVLCIGVINCCCRTSYKRFFSRYSCNDEGASLRREMVYGMLFNILSTAYHVLNVLHAVRMFKSDLMLLSDFLQKVFPLQ